MSTIPLTDAQLRAAAPSIFAETPIDGVSDRYAFIPTSSILESFRKANYYPILAGESKANNAENIALLIYLFISAKNFLRSSKLS